MSLIFSVRILFYTDTLDDGTACGASECTAAALHTEHYAGVLKHSELIVGVLDIVSVGECGRIKGEGTSVYALTAMDAVSHLLGSRVLFVHDDYCV